MWLTQRRPIQERSLESDDDFVVTEISSWYDEINQSNEKNIKEKNIIPIYQYNNKNNTTKKKTTTSEADNNISNTSETHDNVVVKEDHTQEEVITMIDEMLWVDNDTIVPVDDVVTHTPKEQPQTQENESETSSEKWSDITLSPEEQSLLQEFEKNTY